MRLTLKILALLFSCVFFIAYGWSERSDLNALEKIFWLMPALALFAVAAIPFRTLSSFPAMKWGVSIVCALGIIKIIQGIVVSFNAPIEPDTPAIILRLVSLGLLAPGLYIMWKRK